MKQTMDQVRIAYALKVIKVWQASRHQSELGNHINSLPALIHMNGLGQALAFYKCNDAAHIDIYKAFSAWLCGDNAGRVTSKVNADILDALAVEDMHIYMAAQNEAQALLMWLKKLAKAHLTQVERS